MLRRGENEQLRLDGREQERQKVALDDRLLGLRPEASLSGLMGPFSARGSLWTRSRFHIVWALELIKSG